MRTLLLFILLLLVGCAGAAPIAQNQITTNQNPNPVVGAGVTTNGGGQLVISVGGGSGFPLTSNVSGGGHTISNASFVGNGAGLTNLQGNGISLTNLANQSYLCQMVHSPLDLSGWSLTDNSPQGWSGTTNDIIWLTNGMIQFARYGFPSHGFRGIFLLIGTAQNLDASNNPILNPTVFPPIGGDHGYASLSNTVALASSLNEYLSLYISMGDTGLGVTNASCGTNHIYQWTQWAMSNGFGGFNCWLDNADTSNSLYLSTFVRLMSQAVSDYNNAYTILGTNGNNPKPFYVQMAAGAGTNFNGTNGVPVWTQPYPDLYLSVPNIIYVNPYDTDVLNFPEAFLLSVLNNPLLASYQHFPFLSSMYESTPNIYTNTINVNRMGCSCLQFAFGWSPPGPEGDECDPAWTNVATTNDIVFQTNYLLNPAFLATYAADNGAKAGTLTYSITNTFIVSLVQPNDTLVCLINTNGVNAAVTFNVTNGNGGLFSNTIYSLSTCFGFVQTFSNQFTYNVNANADSLLIITPTTYSTGTADSNSFSIFADGIQTMRFDPELFGYNNIVVNGALNSIIGSIADSIIGGVNNKISAGANFSVVAGGAGNVIALNVGNVISGGENNSVYGSENVIGGGVNNLITNNSFWSTIPGGTGNIITAGGYSFVAGTSATSSHNGSFVWSDDTGGAVDTGANQFIVKSSGGVQLITGGAGATLDGNAILTNGSIVSTGQYVSNNAGIGTNITLTSATTFTGTAIHTNASENFQAQSGLNTINNFLAGGKTVWSFGYGPVAYTITDSNLVNTAFQISNVNDTATFNGPLVDYSNFIGNGAGLTNLNFSSAPFVSINNGVATNIELFSTVAITNNAIIQLYASAGVQINFYTNLNNNFTLNVDGTTFRLFGTNGTYLIVSNNTGVITAVKGFGNGIITAPSYISVTASPFTYTAGTSDETIVFFGSATTSAVTWAGTSLTNAVALTGSFTLPLGPAQTIVVTYTATPPVMIKKLGQ